MYVSTDSTSDCERPRSGIVNGNCLTSAVAVGSPDCTILLGEETHFTSQSCGSLDVIPLRSGPTVLPLPIVWHAAHFAVKIVEPSSAFAAAIAQTGANATAATASKCTSRTRLIFSVLSPKAARCVETE